MKTATAILIPCVTVFCAASPRSAWAADKATTLVKPYPLEVCVVSGEKLGSMGDPLVLNYDGQEVQLCCKDCKKDFVKEPAKYMSTIKEANKKVKRYSRDTCLVSGEKLGDESRAIVFQWQEIKFCCKDCEKEFRRKPRPHLAKLKQPPGPVE